MKVDKNAKIGVVWGVMGHPRSSETSPLDRVPMTSYSTIVWHYSRDPTFSHIDRIPECDRQTDRQRDRHTTIAYSALSIASRGKMGHLT